MIGIAGGKWFSISNGKASEKSEISETNNAKVSENGEGTLKQEDKIPANVYEILKYIETFHEPKEGYLGGGVFHNYEKLLPENTANNDPINYSEWDVHPKIKDMPRGKERLVTGDDKSAWFTDDHYKSFINIH